MERRTKWKFEKSKSSVRARVKVGRKESIRQLSDATMEKEAWSSSRSRDIPFDVKLQMTRISLESLVESIECVQRSRPRATIFSLLLVIRARVTRRTETELHIHRTEEPGRFSEMMKRHLPISTKTCINAII